MDAATIFVLGPPGAGKGTLCKRLAQRLNLYHLSVGDYLRQIRRDPSSANGQRLNDYLGQNELKKCLPGDLLIPMLWDKIAEEEEHASGFFVDGFPRSQKQLQTFEKGKEPRQWLVISFECPDDICKERFLTRSYQDRKDDESMFAFRIEEYHANTPGIVKELSDTHQCNIVKVDTSATESDTWETLLHALYSAGFKTADQRRSP